MAISAGLVGLPNVGKSTIFNALTHSSISAENYPFCTIDPNFAITTVPDSRIEELQKKYAPEKIIPAYVQFVDIAGLVRGAASGEGLGNKFLSHIYEVDLILHVLRCFEDKFIVHAHDELDPLVDFDIISTELMFKDLESIEKRQAKVVQLIKHAKSDPVKLKEYTSEHELLGNLQRALNDGDLTTFKRVLQASCVRTIPLLSAKKSLILANIGENDLPNDAYKKNRSFQKLESVFGSSAVIPICARLEYELSQLDEREADEMAAMMDLKQRAIQTIIAATFKNLGLISFFTCGPQEVHAWPIKDGTTIRRAAGEIHSDLERGFICADVFNYTDLIACGSEAQLRLTGKIRTEGQDYRVQDGDIIHVKFNVR